VHNLVGLLPGQKSKSLYSRIAFTVAARLYLCSSPASTS
jgi:hypothetical protein